MSISRSLRALGASALVAFAGNLAVAHDAAAVVVRVSQESAAGTGDFDANVLGFVGAFAGGAGLDAAGVYQYGSPFGASYNGEGNGGPDPVSGTSQLFLVEATDGLSLFIVHDRPRDAGGGSAETAFELLGDTAAILVEDDRESGYTDTGTSFGADHNWAPCCTDGYVIGTLEGGWTMFGEFLSAPSRIEAWQVTDAGGGDIALVLELERRVRLDVVPEPASLALLGLGLLGAGFARRRAAARA